MDFNLFITYSELILLFSLITFYFSNVKSQIKSNYFWFAFLTLPIVFFFYTIFSSTDDIPFKDDYTLLESIYQMEFSSSFSELSKSFFKQVNQHRFGFERSIMWLIYQVFGHENIKAQIIIGNAFLLGILYFFFNLFKKLRISLAYFTPIPLILFNLTYFENATWGIAAIQNTPIIFFAILTVYCLSLELKNSFFWAIISAMITLFTSGNGVGIWLVGIMILFLQKRWKNLSIWTILMVLSLTFYFTYDYEIIPSDRINLLRHPFLNIQYLLAFWGNIFFQNISHSNSSKRYWDIILCILCGIFLSLIMLSMVWKNFKNRSQKISQELMLLMGSSAFLAITGLMLVVSRPTAVKIINGGDLLARRYMIFGAAFFCLGYLSYLYLFRERKIIQKFGLSCFILVSLFLNLNSYYSSISDVYRQQQELKLDGYYWKNHQMLLSFGEKYGDKIGWNHPTYMINLINKLDSSGIYRLSQNETLPLVNMMKISLANTASKFDGTLDSTMSNGTTTMQQSRERILFTGVTKSVSQKIKYFALKSQKNVFLFPAVPKVNSIKECFLTQSLMSSEFNYEIWKAKFPSDLYEIWVIEEQDKNSFKPLFCQKKVQL